ncbi:hypothetical protein GCM10020229_09030 [Kitasatospora albolonga]|uniref:DoxX family protein n=1 Tax=Kitasatospora albolonga TaxID=68173 RepID=UPI0031E72409
MNVTTTVVTVIAALMSGFSAYALLSRQVWVVQPLEQYGVPKGWWNLLGAAKAAGALGLLVGLAVEPLGLAAGIGLVAYYGGAVVTVLRARAWGHVPFPMVYAAPVVAALVLAA